MKQRRLVVHFLKKEVVLTVQHLGYVHPNGDKLFDDLNFVVNRYEKLALVGANGAGKSTLLKILARKISPTRGVIKADARPYYLPQHFGQFDAYSLADALRVSEKISALHAILAGEVSEEHLVRLDDDWTIEERCAEAMAHWALPEMDLSRPLGTLSGGQKTKVFLAGIRIHQPEIVLLDEPSNHLDLASRALLYNFIRSTPATLVVVSHDRTLLNLLGTVAELSRRGIAAYGGNYDFYRAQKAAEAEAFQAELRSKEKALRKAKEVERASLERQQKLDARGRKKQDSAGVPTIMLNTLRNNAERSTARVTDAHADKVSGIVRELSKLREELPDKEKMKIGFEDSSLHQAKLLVSAQAANFGWNEKMLWQNALTFEIRSGQRTAIKGFNGSGKTSLIRLVVGELEPTLGSIQRADFRWLYIDQDYSLVDDGKAVFEQAQHFNSSALEEHLVKSRLTHFLFMKDDWGKPVGALSGGEKMRLVLCCLTMSSTAPDLVVLDEPTNNLDIQNTEILTDAVNDYQGTLIVVSHDEVFLQEVGVTSEIILT